VRVLADSVASLPVRVYRDAGNGRQAAGPDTRLVRLLQHPSPGSTRCDLLSQIMVHLNIAGNAFVAKWRVDGQVISLSLLPPDTVQVMLRGPRSTPAPPARTGSSRSIHRVVRSCCWSSRPTLERFKASVRRLPGL
jgi:phage portal protein BeeE